jgi:hypothetical protein
MQLTWILLLLAAGALLALLYPGWRKRRVLGQPFPQAWLHHVHAALPYFPRLKPQEQQQLRDLIRLFLAEKTFYGCNGQQIDDEVRITIAAQACLLLLNRKTSVFPRLQHILVYPTAFVTDEEVHNEDGTVSDSSRELLGESWHYGKVILSWDDIVYGRDNPDDGENVVLHEFAHQLDAEYGFEDGVPELRRNAVEDWSSVMTREFEALAEAADRAEDTLLDPYGATDPAEFFAVITETFFELPGELRAEHPELYAELRKFYCVEPALWR